MSGAMNTAPSDATSLKRHGYVGLLAVVGLFGGLVAWSALTEIAGAIVAPGILVVADNAKKVQHPEGGVVAQLFVQNADHVEQGQLLAVLEQTTISAALAISEAQLQDAYAREARLVAEIEGRGAVVLSPTVRDMFSAGALDGLTALQQQILTARQSTKAGSIAQLQEQIVQLERQREGLQLQQAAIERQLAIIEREMADFEDLYADRLIAASRGTGLEKELSATEGERGQIVAAIAQAQAGAAERALEMAQIEAEYLSEALAELQDVRRIIAEAGQRRIADQDRLMRTAIRAPQTGIVHESILHTIGGVVGGGETLMLIVPTDDPLVVNVRVEPVDIDRVSVGQDVVLRFSGLNPRTTPELFATVSAVAPDATADPATGHLYYAAKIAIPDEQLARLGTDMLLPGMPVESFMQTGNRTVLSYIVHPMAEQLNRAFLED